MLAGDSASKRPNPKTNKMKTILFTAFGIWLSTFCQAQSYPEPEFANEVYWYSRDSSNKLVRLEKSFSKLDTKTKMAGFGGAESSYNIEGGKSSVRLPDGSVKSFVISKQKDGMFNSKHMDSMMRANGMDPAMMEAMQDPSKTITLYKVEPEKENRKITMQKTPGAMPFGSKKIKSSDKYSFSVKKVRDGYYELVIDKPLKPGEYAFVAMNTGAPSMDGSVLVFAFAIE